MATELDQQTVGVDMEPNDAKTEVDCTNHKAGNREEDLEIQPPFEPSIIDRLLQLIFLRPKNVKIVLFADCCTSFLLPCVLLFSILLTAFTTMIALQKGRFQYALVDNTSCR